MKIKCAYSSIESNVDHFPGIADTRETVHPIFHIPQKKLLSYTSKWATGELTETDSYLLFLAILNSTELIQFRTAAIKTVDTPAIIANNMQQLVLTVSRLNSVSALRQIFPEFVVSNETRTLANVRYWLEVWQENYESFNAGNVREIKLEKLRIRENALERMIKSPHVSVSSYSKKLASWAAIAGNFPEYLVQHPKIKEQKIPMSEYWQMIIIRLAKEDDIFNIDSQDIFDLYEHIQLNIPYGTIQSNLLMKIMKKVVSQHRNLLSLGEPILEVEYDILDSPQPVSNSSQDLESNELSRIIESAPDSPPNRMDYNSQHEYLKAKMRYLVAKNAGKF